jgi:hypothetical protein
MIVYGFFLVKKQSFFGRHATQNVPDPSAFKIERRT